MGLNRNNKSHSRSRTRFYSPLSGNGFYLERGHLDGRADVLGKAVAFAEANKHRKAARLALERRERFSGVVRHRHGFGERHEHL